MQVGDAQPDDAEPGADERRLATVDVEDLGREQAADAEHRDEREQQRHQRDAADVEVDDAPPRMSSTRTVISSSPPPTSVQTTKTRSSTGMSIIAAFAPSL